MKLLIKLERIILLSFISVSVSCSTYYSNKYYLSGFDKNDVDHFPLKYKKRGFIRSSFGEPNITFFLSNHIKNKAIDLIIDKFKNDIIATGKHSDSCFYILNGSYCFDPDKMHDCKEIIPVPSLNEDVREFIIGEGWMLPNDFTFYILGYSTVSDTTATLKNIIYKQTRFTKGFAICMDKRIINF